MVKVLGTSRIPDILVEALSGRFQLTSLDGTPLLTDLWKGGGVHAFLGRLMAKAAPESGLLEFTLLGVYQDGGAHIIHSLFSVPVGPYDPKLRLFGCLRESPPEGIPSINEIPVTSFGALRAISAVSREDHRVHLEGVPPSGWLTTSCERGSRKEEGRSLSFRGLSFLPPDAAAPFFHLEGSVGDFSKQIFLVLANQEPLYKEALDWLQFPFTGGTKDQYTAPAHTTFYFSSPIEGEPLFLLALELPQTLHKRLPKIGSVLANQEPLYKEALDWLQFPFTGGTKDQYTAPAHTTFYFSSPVEGEPLFLLALELPQTLYPGA